MIQQGALGASNVDLMRAMTSLSKSGLAFNAKAMTIQDSTLDHTIALGKVK